MAIWGAGAAEDYRVATAPTGEPIITSMSPEPEIATTKPGFRPTEQGRSAYELWQIQKKKRDLRQEYLNYWEETVKETGTGRPVDAIISPVAAYTAPPHGMNKSASSCRILIIMLTSGCRSADYTMIWNALDYPALSLPVSRVDATLDMKKPAHTFYNNIDKANYELCLSSVSLKDSYLPGCISDDPSTFKNAPISVQVVGRTLEEEAVIAMSEIVDSAIKASSARS